MDGEFAPYDDGKTSVAETPWACRDTWNSGVESIFMAYMSAIARFPKTFFAVGLVLLVACCFGVILAEEPESVIEIFLEAGSIEEDWNKFYSQYFGGFSRSVVLMVAEKQSSGNVLEREHLSGLLHIMKSLLDPTYEAFQTTNLTSPSGDTVLVSELDFCETPGVPGYMKDPDSDFFNDLRQAPGIELPEGFSVQRFPCNQISILDCFQEGGFHVPEEVITFNRELCKLDECIMAPYTSKPSLFDENLDIPNYLFGELQKNAEGRPSNCTNWGGMPIGADFVLGDLGYEDPSVLIPDYAQYARMGMNNYNQDHPLFRARFGDLGWETAEERKSLVEKFESFLIDDLLMPAYEASVGSGFAYSEEFSDTELLFSVARSIDDSQNEQLNTVRWELLIIGYAIMIVYAIIWMGNLPFIAPNNYGESRIIVVAVCVVLLALSVFASFGVVSLFGIKLSGIAYAIIPFIGLGLGVDDLFIILHCISLVNSVTTFDEDVLEGGEVEEKTPEKERSRRVMTNAMRLGGPSVLLSTVSIFFAFLAAAFAASVPQTSWFAYHMVVLCLLNFFTFLFLFLPLLYLDLRTHRDGCAFARKATPTTPPPPPTLSLAEPSYGDFPTSSSERTSERSSGMPPYNIPSELSVQVSSMEEAPADDGSEGVSPTLTKLVSNKLVLAIIIVVILIAGVISFMGVQGVERKLDISQSMVDGSYQKDFFEPMLRYFKINSLYMVTKTIDWPVDYPSVLDTMRAIENSEGYIPSVPITTLSWLYNYLDDTLPNWEYRSSSSSSSSSSSPSTHIGGADGDEHHLAATRGEEMMEVNGIVVMMSFSCRDSRDVNCYCGAGYPSGACSATIHLASDPSISTTTDANGAYTLMIPSSAASHDGTSSAPYVVIRLTDHDQADASGLQFQSTLSFEAGKKKICNFGVMDTLVGAFLFGYPLLPDDRSSYPPTAYGDVIGPVIEGWSMHFQEKTLGGEWMHAGEQTNLHPIYSYPIEIFGEQVCSDWRNDTGETSTCGAYGLSTIALNDADWRRRQVEEFMLKVSFTPEGWSGNGLCTPKQLDFSDEMLMSPNYLSVSFYECEEKLCSSSLSSCTSCPACCDDLYSAPDVCSDCHDAKCPDVYVPDCSYNPDTAVCPQCRPQQAADLFSLTFAECNGCYVENCAGFIQNGSIDIDLQQPIPDDDEPVEDFYPSFNHWLAREGTPYSADVVCVSSSDYSQLMDCTDESAVIAASRMPYFLEGRIEDESFIERLEEQRRVLAGTDSYPWDYTIIYTAQYDNIERNTVRMLFLCAVLVSLVTLLLQASWVTSLLLFGNILFTALEMYGLLYFLGLGLNSYSQVLLIMSIGMAIEFSVHMSRAFLLACGTRETRAVKAMGETGLPLFHGALSSFISILAISLNPVAWFRLYFFQYLTAVIVVSFVNGVIFMPVFLAHLGPKRVRRENLPHFRPDEIDVPPFCL